ncbi:MAG TPA: FAD-dependent oxidoreductase [Actinoplanes sp.]|nr:FAD-dependent oxidoreductase [Actinoplanes sp.]
MNSVREVVVVGAGVVGLTTAVRLAEAGHPVRIVAAGFGDATTSYAAGATWSPYLVEWSDRARAWSFETLDEMRRLSADPAAGIALVPGTEAAPAPVGPPEWADRLAGFAMTTEVPAGFVAGWRFTAPVMHMPTYLSYLRDRARRAGATMEERTVDRLDLAPVVVNCTGIGARELVPDEQLIPVRGQVVIVANPGITEWFVGESDPPVYYFPHGDTVLLGGTAGHARSDEEIRDRCAEIEPLLRGAPIVERRTGLRPTRPAVRLEAEHRDDTLVIHNYGHGGAGITLSWGCADAVVRLAGAWTR